MSPVLNYDRIQWIFNAQASELSFLIHVHKLAFKMAAAPPPFQFAIDLSIGGSRYFRTGGGAVPARYIQNLGVWGLFCCSFRYTLHDHDFVVRVEYKIHFVNIAS